MAKPKPRRVVLLLDESSASQVAVQLLRSRKIQFDELRGEAQKEYFSGTPRPTLVVNAKVYGGIAGIRDAIISNPSLRGE